MSLQLKPSRRRPRSTYGHPWAYINELDGAMPEKLAGKGAPLLDSRGKLLGSGLCNPKSQIAWRRYSKGEVKFNAEYINAALEASIARREEDDFRRLVWSEADGLPGLVVDQFDDVLVVQSLTLGVEKVLDTIIAPRLVELLKPAEIIFRNDAPTRELEGLDRHVRTRSTQSYAPRWFQIGEIEYFLDLENGQKTGFYLDQRGEHFVLSTYAENLRVLDCFCNQGAFALNCAHRGATSVTAIDSSADAIQLAKKNAAQNELEVNFVEANVFDWFSEHRDDEYDLIILDPPSFARNKAAVEGALRGYKEINLRAMKLLSPGGILATYSCSNHISRELYLEMLAHAAHDAGRVVQQLELMMQPPDHPIMLNFPESEYLKGAILRVF